MGHAGTVTGVLRSAYLRTSIGLFGNHVGLKINALYGLYLMLFGLLSRVGILRRVPVTDANARRRASELSRRGYVAVEPFLSAEALAGLEQKAAALFADDSKTIRTLEEGGLLRLRDSLNELPELEGLITHPQVAGTIEAYFGGPFKTFSCDVYRTFPSNAADPSEAFPSLQWHFDNCPGAMLKLMIYLRDTARDTGALSIVPKLLSTSLKRRGCWERKQMAAFKPQLDAGAVTLEGKRGTVLLFSTHHCLHKATLPRIGYRDVAVLLVQPSLVPPPPWDEQARRTFSRNYGYCINPFSNRPLRTGDE
jgi:hypothetical protein